MSSTISIFWSSFVFGLALFIFSLFLSSLWFLQTLTNTFSSSSTTHSGSSLKKKITLSYAHSYLSFLTNTQPRIPHFLCVFFPLMMPPSALHFSLGISICSSSSSPPPSRNLTWTPNHHTMPKTIVSCATCLSQLTLQRLSPTFLKKTVSKKWGKSLTKGQKEPKKQRKQTAKMRTRVLIPTK